MVYFKYSSLLTSRVPSYRLCKYETSEESFMITAKSIRRLSCSNSFYSELRHEHEVIKKNEINVSKSFFINLIDCLLPTHLWLFGILHYIHFLYMQTQRKRRLRYCSSTHKGLSTYPTSQINNNETYADMTNRLPRNDRPA